LKKPIDYKVIDPNKKEIDKEKSIGGVSEEIVIVDTTSVLKRS
jgi:hypothetical protein